MKKGLVFCLVIIAVLGSFPINLSAQNNQDKLRLEKLSASLVYLSRAQVFIDESIRCCEQKQYLSAIECLDQALRLIDAAEASLFVETMPSYKRTAIRDDIKSLRDMIADMKKNANKMMLMEQLLEKLEQKKEPDPENKKTPGRSSRYP